jgi:hypothetical protein
MFGADRPHNRAGHRAPGRRRRCWRGCRSLWRWRVRAWGPSKIIIKVDAVALKPLHRNALTQMPPPMRPFGPDSAACAWRGRPPQRGTGRFGRLDEHDRRIWSPCPCRPRLRCHRPIAMRLKMCGVCGVPFVAGRAVDLYSGDRCRAEAVRRAKRRPDKLAQKAAADARHNLRNRIAAWAGRATPTR